eukprot:7843201-Pyramimonas_sp.AAC.2
MVPEEVEWRRLQKGFGAMARYSACQRDSRMPLTRSSEMPHVDQLEDVVASDHLQHALVPVHSEPALA